MILDVLLLEIVLLLTFSLALGTWQRDPTTMGRLTFCALCIAVADDKTPVGVLGKTSGGRNRTPDSMYRTFILDWHPPTTGVH